MRHRHVTPLDVPRAPSAQQRRVFACTCLLPQLVEHLHRFGQQALPKVGHAGHSLEPPIDVEHNMARNPHRLDQPLLGDLGLLPCLLRLLLRPQRQRPDPDERTDQREHPTDSQDLPPSCPTHNRPMQRGKRGDWYCPVKVADDDGTGKPVYCKQRR